MMSPENIFSEVIFDTVAWYFQAVKWLAYSESQMHFYIFRCDIIVNDPAELICCSPLVLWIKSDLALIVQS